jgi:selenocysteine lyase/cysteine desulfurase
VTFDVAAVRRQFPILSEIIDGRPIHYLDNGASAQTPLAVIDAVRAYETTSRANVLRGVHRLAEPAATWRNSSAFSRWRSSSPVAAPRRSTSWLTRTASS